MASSTAPSGDGGVEVPSSDGAGVGIGADADGAGVAGTDDAALAAVTPEPSSTASTATAAAVETARVRAGRAADRRDDNLALSRDARRRVGRRIVADGRADSRSGRVPVLSRWLGTDEDRLFES
uniref:hypothetical protein n=1 Tax=Microbacterium sp. SORGH_AS_1204 TaxID=3041785 RepID=UPI0027D8A651|nr:hypothetical protein [Microbacterium sp. SORGH_AS_1204]